MFYEDERCGGRMSSSNPTLGAIRETRRASPVGFILLVVLALALAGFALYKGQAPVRTPYPEDWIIWARGTSTWAGALAVGFVVMLIGVIGLVLNLRSAPKAQIETRSHAAPDIEIQTAPAVDLQTATRTSDSRGTLRFNAEKVAAIPLSNAPAAPAGPSLAYTAASHRHPATLSVEAAPEEVQSLEPMIFSDHAAFSDNASDSFMTRAPEDPVAVTSEVPVFDAGAALFETHGLHIHAQPASAEIVPIRPAGVHTEIPAIEDAPHDPLAAALLAETPDVVTQAPPSDINAVISSAMRFAPQSEAYPHPQPAASTPVDVIPDVVPAPVPEAIAPVEALPVTSEQADIHPAPEIVMPAPIAQAIAPAEATPVTSEQADIRQAPEIVMPAPIAQAIAPAEATPVIDEQADIRQATETALSVWPDATRAIAADELSARVAHLYYDKSPRSQQAFSLIAAGDLSGAAGALASQADVLALAGNHAAAAELWRVFGALHMGRDDAQAMTAYEHVSELDPTDANIHLYLARRYQMAGDTAKQPAVIVRALNVINDPATRAELLAPYADLKLKAGDAKAAGDALEELSRLQESDSYLRPDDVSLRSTLAITVARLAQAREMQGAFDQAGPLYRKAHKVFADLSAMKPEHPGLRAMADNALRDAQRFNVA
jgi:tetratricopeptide (TPR) repeat protein